MKNKATSFSKCHLILFFFSFKIKCLFEKKKYLFGNSVERNKRTFFHFKPKFIMQMVMFSNATGPSCKIDYCHQTLISINLN